MTNSKIVFSIGKNVYKEVERITECPGKTDSLAKCCASDRDIPKFAAISCHNSYKMQKLLFLSFLIISS